MAGFEKPKKKKQESKNVAFEFIFGVLVTQFTYPIYSFNGLFYSFWSCKVDFDENEQISAKSHISHPSPTRYGP